MGFDGIQDSNAAFQQQEFIRRQQEAAAQTQQNNQLQNANTLAQVTEQNKLPQNQQQQLAYSTPGITTVGNKNFGLDFTKTKTENEYKNYTAVKTANGDKWLIGTDTKSKGYAIAPDGKTAYKLSNSDAVQNRLNSDSAQTHHLSSDLKYEGIVGPKGNQYAEMREKDGSKIFVGVSKAEKDSTGNIGWAYKQGDKTTHKIDNPEALKSTLGSKASIDQIKSEPKIADAIKKNEDFKNKTIKMAGIAAELGTTALNYALPTTTGSLSDSLSQTAKEGAEDSMRKAMTPDLSTKEAKQQALNDVIMEHASNPEAAIAKLITSGNSDAEELGKAIHYLDQKEIKPELQAKYFQQMEKIASPYIKQMESLETNNDIQGMEKLANDPKYSEIMNYYGNYHQTLQQNGRTMNGFDAEVYRTLFNKYK